MDEAEYAYDMGVIKLRQPIMVRFTHSSTRCLWTNWAQRAGCSRRSSTWIATVGKLMDSTPRVKPDDTTIDQFWRCRRWTRRARRCASLVCWARLAQGAVCARRLAASSSTAPAARALVYQRSARPQGGRSAWWPAATSIWGAKVTAEVVDNIKDLGFKLCHPFWHHDRRQRYPGAGREGGNSGAHDG